MTKWYEQANPGGPMVGPAFIRPLYPPDAAEHGKRPSDDGDDVEAIKRAVSRSGHWPWQTFDGAYSNGFAHGRSGNVSDNGLAGLQRQNGLDATGWMGEKTYNLIRSARVPAGLPHAGEPLLDPVAIELLESYARTGSSSPVGPLIRKAIPSPNYSSRGGAAVRLIVLHTAEGALTIESLGNFFASGSSGVSSHAGIDDQLGTIGEYVKRSGKAWTAGNANPVAVQAELCGFASWSRAEWDDHPHMLENCARWIAEEAAAFGLPIVKLSPSSAQGSGRGVCQHDDLGSWGGGHWDCGGEFPIDSVLARANELKS